MNQKQRAQRGISYPGTLNASEVRQALRDGSIHVEGNVSHKSAHGQQAIKELFA